MTPPVSNPRWQTLSDAVTQAERDDPDVAEAARGLEDAMAELAHRHALHTFRPLPWDRT